MVRKHLALLLLALSLSQGIPMARAAEPLSVYKDKTETVGVPDIGQGDTAYCEAAAMADGIWWFNQYHPGLVDTTPQGWYDRSTKLFQNLSQRMYEQQQKGVVGALFYIQDKRPQDFRAAHDPKAPQNPPETVSTWGIQSSNWKAIGKGQGTDLLAQATMSLNNTHQFSAVKMVLHESGKPAETMYGNSAHRLAYAGQQTTDGILTNLVTADGWPPNHEDQPNPVSAEYYDKYTAKVEQPKVPGYNVNQLRVTDKAFLDGWGVPQGTTVDYAFALGVQTLRDNFKAYSLSRFSELPQLGGVGSGASASLVLGRQILENDGEGPLTEFVFELPLQDPTSLGWESGFSWLELPSGWTASFWDPNSTPYMTPPADLAAFEASGTGPVLRAYRGLRLTTTSAPLENGESLDVSFLINRSMLDLSRSVTSYAIADSARDYFAEGLALRSVPEPETLSLLEVGLAVLLLISKRESTREAARADSHVKSALDKLPPRLLASQAGGGPRPSLPFPTFSSP